jgi:hypothetical protein
MKIDIKIKHQTFGDRDSAYYSYGIKVKEAEEDSSPMGRRPNERITKPNKNIVSSECYEPRE